MSDFFLPLVVSVPLDNATIAAFQQVLIKAQETMTWLPNIAGESSSLFYGSPAHYPNLNSQPAGLTVSQQQQWTMVCNAMQPITASFLKGEMASAQQAGVALAANVAFWDTVARIDEDIATLGVSELWTKLWEAVDACKASRDATVITLQTAQDALDNLGSDSPTALIDDQATLSGQLSQLVDNVKSTLSPLGADAVQQAGLGTALIVAGIAGAIVVTITASVWAISHELTAVQMQANDHAQAVFNAQTAYDEAQAASGAITQDELMQRRANTAGQMKTVVDAQGAAAVGKGLQAAGVGMAMGLGALALGVIGVIYMLRKSKGSPAPSTNPRRRRR